MKKTIGILALQGDFAAHAAALAQLGAELILVRSAAQLRDIHALIIPGGESTTMLKLLRDDNMMQAMQKFALEKPILGTCAGAILLAKTIIHPAQESLAVIDMIIERNAYGRQYDSRIVEIELEKESRVRPENSKLEAVFIRAPIIRKVGGEVKILAYYAGDPVLIEQGHHMATTFHPELTADLSIHAYFLEKI